MHWMAGAGLALLLPAPLLAGEKNFAACERLRTQSAALAARQAAAVDRGTPAAQVGAMAQQQAQLRQQMKKLGCHRSID